MPRRKLFARRKRPAHQPAPGPAAPAPRRGRAPATALPGPVRLVALAAGIYAAAVAAGGLGVGLDWALAQVTPLPQGLLATTFAAAALFGLSYQAVHRRGWADAAGLIRAGLLVAAILAAGAAGLLTAVGGPAPAAAGLIGAWLVVILGALEHPPRDAETPPATAAADAGAADDASG